MKMLGPRGIITVAKDYKRSLARASDSAKMAETLVCSEELRQLKRKISEELPEVPESASPTNRKVSSSTSSVRIGTSLHGLLEICRVSRGSSPSTLYTSDRTQNRLSNHYAASQKKEEK